MSQLILILEISAKNFVAVGSMLCAICKLLCVFHYIWFFRTQFLHLFLQKLFIKWSLCFRNLQYIHCLFCGKMQCGHQVVDGIGKGRLCPCTYVFMENADRFWGLVCNCKKNERIKLAQN